LTQGCLKLCLKVTTMLIGIRPGPETLELVYPIYCERHDQKGDHVFAERGNDTAVAMFRVTRLHKRENNCEGDYCAQVENSRQTHQNAKPECSPRHHQIRASASFQP